MKSSDEVKNAVLRLYEAVSAGDVGELVLLFSRENGLLVIGSDPTEWWADYDTITGAFEA